MRLIDFAAAGPVGTFRSGVDLFGDGTIWLVPTPGHTRGHCSVIVCLRSGPILLAGDAAYLLAHVTGEATKSWEVRWFIDFDGDESADSLARIRRFRDLVPGLVVVPGHDPEAWDGLRHLPEFYE